MFNLNISRLLHLGNTISGVASISGIRKEDQTHLDRLLAKARIHVEAAGSASRPWPFETLVVAVLLEHEKVLAELTGRLGTYEEEGGSVRDGGPSDE